MASHKFIIGPDGKLVIQAMSTGGKVAGAGAAALGGAGAGAALGTAIAPGIGTAIGAVGGGLVGALGSLFDGSDPEPTNLISPVSPEQLNAASSGVSGGLDQYQELLNAINNSNGIQNQQDVYGRLTGLADGTGPNPAQDLLNMETGKNVSQIGALLASQRGSNYNPGLIARTAARAGGDIQQQAAGQAAALQSNQTLNAINQMQGLANTQAGQQIAGTAGYNAAQQGAQGNLLSAAGGINNANVASTANANNVALNDRLQNNRLVAAGIGGVTQGVGTAFANNALPKIAPNSLAGSPGFNNAVSNVSNSYSLPKIGSSSGYAKGGMVNAPKMMPSHLKALGSMYGYWEGGEASPMPMLMGGEVPGTAQVKGDSPKNDTALAALSPGEMVIPKSVMESKDPVKEAGKFVAAHMKKNAAPAKDFKEALKKAISTRKSK